MRALVAAISHLDGAVVRVRADSLHLSLPSRASIIQKKKKRKMDELASRGFFLLLQFRLFCFLLNLSWHLPHTHTDMPRDVFIHLAH